VPENNNYHLVIGETKLQRRGLRFWRNARSRRALAAPVLVELLLDEDEGTIELEGKWLLRRSSERRLRRVAVAHSRMLEVQDRRRGRTVLKWVKPLS
jgi:hypothetical protein